MIGALLGRKLTLENEGRVLLIGTIIFTGALALIAPLTVFWPVPLFIFASGLADGVGHVAELHITQRRAPDSVRSRVIAATQAVVSIAFALGFVLAAPLLTAVGPRWTYVVGGVIGVAAALMLIPAVRELHRSMVRRADAGEPELVVEDLTIAMAPAPDEGTLTRED